MLKHGWDGNYTLLYDNGTPVELGDTVDLDGKAFKVTWATPPHKPGSIGKIAVGNREYFVTVFNMRWKHA